MRIMRLMVGILWLAGTVAMGQPMTFKDQAFLMAVRNLRLVPPIYWTPTNVAVTWNDNAGSHITNSTATFLATADTETVSFLDLSGAGLTSISNLYCLTGLTNLNLSGNALTNINVSLNLSLAILNGNQNSLSSIDLTQNAQLRSALLANNSLTTLNISSNALVANVYCLNNLLSQAAVDEILHQLVINGLSNGQAYLSGTGNAAPSATGQGYRSTLEGRGWFVLNN